MILINTTDSTIVRLRWLQNYLSFVDTLLAKEVSFDPASRGSKFYEEIKWIFESLEWRYFPYKPDFGLNELVNKRDFEFQIDALFRRYKRS